MGVLPNLPTRSGEKPALSLVATHSEVAKLVKIWLTNNPGKEVGVLVFDDTGRSAMTEALEQALGSLRGRNIRVQTYSWKTRAETKADDLLFDTPDVVTVLNLQSCKGLEFDAVFIVDLHRAPIGLYGADRFKMQMFVATSRGREWVQLIDSGRNAGSGPWTEYLPGPEHLDRDDRSRQTRVTRGRQTVNNVAGKSGHWFSELQSVAKKRSLQIDDRREDGGAVWVYGGKELASLLEPRGFAYSEKRSGWWRKS